MKRFSAFLIATAALIGCNQPDHGVEGTPTQEQTPQVERSGNVVKEFNISKESIVRFTEKDGYVNLTVQGPILEREKNMALEEKLFQSKTMEAAYRVMDPVGAVPQAILDYDKRPAVAEDQTAPAAVGAVDQVGPVSSLPAKTPLAKESDHANPAGDANWDWNADANWWKKSVVGYSCQWHNAAAMTNYWWVDDWRYGWMTKGYVMAASHTFGAYAWAWLWNGSTWVQTHYTYIKPRHYFIWSTGDTSKRYRRYKVEGLGGNVARVHWGMRWDTQAPSDLDVICIIN